MKKNEYRLDPEIVVLDMINASSTISPKSSFTSRLYDVSSILHNCWIRNYNLPSHNGLVMRFVFSIYHPEVLDQQSGC